MLQIINQRLEKMMPIITPASVGIGVSFSDYLNHLTYLVPWIFAFITFSGSLSSSFKSLQRAFLYPLPLIIALLILHVIMPVWNMMVGLFFMIVVPALIGMVSNHITKGSIKDTLGKRLSPFSKIGLGIVIAINSSFVAPYLSNIDVKLVIITLIVLFIAFSGYCFAWGIAKLLRRDRDTTVTVLFTGGMRNISTGAVLAIQYFPAPVAVPVVVGMLFQQILASVFGLMLARSESHAKAALRS